jgi:hypothetical protein
MSIDAVDMDGEGWCPNVASTYVVERVRLGLTQQNVRSIIDRNGKKFVFDSDTLNPAKTIHVS